LYDLADYGTAFMWGSVAHRTDNAWQAFDGSPSSLWPPGPGESENMTNSDTGDLLSTVSGGLIFLFLQQPGQPGGYFSLVNAITFTWHNFH
jgi:hypothetical protein